MTNLQLLFTIGIPSLLVILSWINSSQRLSRLEAGQDALHKRIDVTDKRIDDARADSHKDALEIMRAMTALHERVAVVETKQGLNS